MLGVGVLLTVFASVTILFLCSKHTSAFLRRCCHLHCWMCFLGRHIEVGEGQTLTCFPEDRKRLQ